MATRKIQKNILNIGNISLEVSLLTAIDSSKAIKAKTVHKSDGGTIKNNRTCSICGDTLQTKDIAKQYVTATGETFILSDDEIKNIPSVNNDSFTVDKFIPADNVNPVSVEKSYYVIPESEDISPFASFVSALYESNKVAVLKFAFHSSTHLGILKAINKNTLLLQQVEYSINVRKNNLIIENETDEIIKEQMLNIISLNTDEDGTLDNYHDDKEEYLLTVLSNQKSLISI